jgi:polyphenol oxidase
VSADLIRLPTAKGDAVVRFGSRADGDVNADRVPVDELAQRWRALAGDRPVTWLDEVHGVGVVPVRSPGERAGTTGDAAITATPGAALGVWTGDCAPVMLVAREGVVAAVHAGWRGLEAGIVGNALGAMRSMGGRSISAVLGPCVHSECYEFGDPELTAMVARFGDAVRSTTASGRPALDLPAAVRESLAVHGIELDESVSVCTACDESYWSHRARSDTERQGSVVWIEPAW